MEKALRELVMVLNRSWIPVRVETVKMSLSRIFAGAAYFIDEDDYRVYDWEKWLASFSVSRYEEWPFSYGYVSAARINIRSPSVILLRDYNKIPRREIQLTKKNVLIRDRYRCQYTGKRISSKDATVDHIIPKSKGGKNSWTNVVACTKDVNVMKGDRTPEQAGIKLLQVPRKPVWDPVYSVVSTQRVRPGWKKFLPYYNDKIMPHDDKKPLSI
jgi:5-methylcytosine-specific restriction endonuclease McrA